MEIRNNFSNQHFKGIKLSSDKFQDAKFVAFELRESGYDPLGHTTVYANNNMKDKIDGIRDVRDTIELQNNEFAMVHLPWSAETYVIARPNVEQKMFPLVKKLDSGAKINLSI